MEIQVRVRFGSYKQEIEKFNDLRYLVRIISKESESDAMDEVIALLSKRLGIPPGKFELKRDDGVDKVFVV